MFAIEISFQDGVSDTETIFVRRPQALVGSSEYAHVVIDDMRTLDFQLRLVRDLGRRFRCRAVGASQAGALPPGVEGSFSGEAQLDARVVRLFVTALDIDLVMKDGEPPDSAGVRIMREACASRSPLFPALVVSLGNPMVVSFSSDQPVLIGRSKQCALRLDASDISARHARIGFENGRFWVEDLGSTNGTFVNKQQISGKVVLDSGAPVVLGRDVSIMCASTEDQIRRAVSLPDPEVDKPVEPQRYPVLVSASEVARPARLVIAPGSVLSVGRDPSSDVWLGAPHVSRRHLEIAASPSGAVTITDHSTNGTAHDQGVLQKGNSMEVHSEPRVLDVGGGLTLAVCFNEEQEKRFLASSGALHVFNDKHPVAYDRAAREQLHGTYETHGPLRAGSAVSVNDDQGTFADWLKDYYRSRNFFGKLLVWLSLGGFVLVLFGVAMLLTQMLLKFK